MIRVLAFIRRLPGVSRDRFRIHYEEIHVPTALPTLGGLLGYLRHHIREDIYGEPGFDCMTRFDYRDAAAIRDALARIQGPEGEAIHRDERLFMDAPANVFFPVEASKGWGKPGAEASPLLVCVRRPPDEEAAAFRARLLERELPALRAAAGGASWCRPEWALPGLGQGKGFDLVAQMGEASRAAIAGWARALEAGNASVVAARVSLHQTPMPG
jgi:uncharacterized protein (TIGR02118 family)